MKSLRNLKEEKERLEKELEVATEKRAKAQSEFFENKTEVTLKTFEATSKLEKALKEKFCEVDFKVKRVEELVEVREKAKGTLCGLALETSEMEELEKVLNKAIKRWLDD